jgi:hypothetical protein
MSKKEEYVLITATEYINLLNESEELSGLEGMGVDNWSGYGEVEWNEIEEACAQTAKDVSNMQKYDKEGNKV